MSEEAAGKALLPHHEQKALCTTRLPYRQGRKLTAVKVYTINTESNHLLAFGVPAINLRQETKALFLKFGNLKHFHISKDHPGEVFTETYHAYYESIQSARIAKRMLDTKNFYGGTLHVCYAPELETIDETRQKLIQRRRDVTYRLKNLNKEVAEECKVVEKIPVETTKPIVYGPIQNEVLDYFEDKNTLLENKVKSKGKLNMGVQNTIYMNRKRNMTINNEDAVEKKFKESKSKLEVEVVDFTSTERNSISNINEALHYNKFGNEVIRTIDVKPVNQIRYNKKADK